MFSSCFLWGKSTGRVPPPARLRHHQPGQPRRAPAPPLTKHRTQPQGHPPALRHPWGHPRRHHHTRRPHHLPCHQPCTNNHSTGLVYMRILHWKLSRFCKLIFPQAHTWKFPDPSAVTTAHHTQILLLFHHDLRILLQ